MGRYGGFCMRGRIQKQYRNLRNKIRCKISGKRNAALACMLFALTLQGCVFQDISETIVQPVEEAVSTVKKNLELRQQMNALAMPKDVKTVSDEKYVYQTLPKEQKKIYDQMLDAMLEQKKEVTISATDGRSLEDIFNCIKADYGGLFWVESFRYTQYQRNGKTEMVSFSPNYTMSKKEREKTQLEIDKKAKAYLKGIDKNASDYKKARYIYKKLIQKVDYNLQSKNNQNIISVFLGKETVCQGYANAMQYLLERLNVPCVVVTGRAKGGPHAWNLVKLDGEWYYCDVTWGNSKYHDEEKNDVKYVEYDYLNITTAEMQKDHTPQVKFPLPNCTAVKNNYYVKEKRYFNSLDARNIDAIGALIQKSYDKGEGNVSVKFSGSALCSQAKQYFLTDYHIGDYCSGLDSVYYKTNTKFNIFVIIFPRKS